jgi:hypothetical protein
MHHVTRSFLAVLCAAALLLGGCSDDGPDAKGDERGSEADEVVGPPEDAPDLAGPILDVSRYEVATRCPEPGPSRRPSSSTTARRGSPVRSIRCSPARRSGCGPPTTGS